MKLLVCGGRHYADRDHVYKTLDELHAAMPIKLIIHGAARGADTLADTWALYRGVGCKPFEADWARFGAAAGPVRNGRMLTEGRPDLVLAFPGGGGTNNMLRQSIACGIPVIRG